MIRALSLNIQKMLDTSSLSKPTRILPHHIIHQF